MPTAPATVLRALVLGAALAALPASAFEPQLQDFFFLPGGNPTDPIGPAVASDAAGNFVLTWLATDGVGRAQEIRATLFDGQGRVRRGPLPVSVGAPGNYSSPVVAHTPSGGWVVAWVRTVESAPRRHYLEMRRFRPLGLALGPPVQVNSDPLVPVQSPALAVDALGRVALAWDSFNNRYPEGSVWLRRYGPKGSPIGPEQPVTVSSGNSVSHPSLVFGSDGALLIGWRVFSGLNEIHVAAGLLPRPSDPVVPPFLVDEISSGFNTSPRLLADPRGGFLAVWDNCLRPSDDGQEGSCSVRARRLGSRAEILSPELQLTPENGRPIHALAAAFADDGTLGLAWASPETTGTPPVYNAPDILVQLFDGDLEPSTDIATLAAADWRGFPALTRTTAGYALFFEEYGQSPDGIFGALLFEPDVELELGEADSDGGL